MAYQRIKKVESRLRGEERHVVIYAAAERGQTYVAAHFVGSRELGTAAIMESRQFIDALPPKLKQQATHKNIGG